MSKQISELFIYLFSDGTEAVVSKYFLESSSEKFRKSSLENSQESPPPSI